MALKRSFVPVSQEQLAEIDELCSDLGPEPSYKVVSQEEIPSVFPESFKAKMDHALIMVSGAAQGRVYFVCNSQRVDSKAAAIDQEPFGVVLDTGNPADSGVFLHHGDWPGRTEPEVPPEFWQHVRKCGIGNCYPPPSLTAGSSRKLQQLSGTSHEGAFKRTVNEFFRLEIL